MRLCKLTEKWNPNYLNVMIQELQTLDETLDKLDEINNSSFVSKNFKEINSQIEKILLKLKSNEQILKKNKFSEDYIKILNNILCKIELLETKILPKANLLNSFSKSKP